MTNNGKLFILEIKGDIVGPSCKRMRLNVYFQNEYANRAYKVFVIENMENNIPATFSGYDEIFPTKLNTTWKVDEVYAECKD